MSDLTMANVRLRRLPAAPYDVAPILTVRYIEDGEGNGNWQWDCPVCGTVGGITPRRLKERRWHTCYPPLATIDPQLAEGRGS